MEPVEYQGIQVDRCNGCGGLWFDLLEQEDLKGLKGSEAIDPGRPGEGAKHDAQARVLCPRDQTRMLPMVDPAQPHIWIESCPVCHGAFFDAGEFKDYKELTLLERLLPRRRPRPL
jgi:Zn-finger nucleic acid-binding protein